MIEILTRTRYVVFVFIGLPRWGIVDFWYMFRSMKLMSNRRCRIDYIIDYFPVFSVVVAVLV